MAGWTDLVEHVKGSYTVASETPRSLRLLFNVGDGRSQVVVVSHHRLRGGTEDWVQLESPIGEVVDEQLRPLVEAAGTKVCGGLGCSGDVVTFQHAFPLKNFDVNEFERPLILITTTADELEKEFVGGDAW